MVIANLRDSDRYILLHPLFQELFAYIKQTDWTTCRLGKIQLKEDILFINYVEVQGAAKDLQPLEFHNRYIDVHIPLSVTETIGWADRASLHEINVPYNDDSDCGFYKERPAQYFELPVGTFAIVFPEDAHAPAIASGSLRKLIAKIKIETI